MAAGFRLEAERSVFEGRVISLVVGSYVSPDGERFEREVVRHPGAVSVVPILEGDAGPLVVLVRQYRAAVDEELLEIPAGKRDVPGEAPVETANRELAEEVGYTAGSLVHLATFHNSVGFSDERSIVYLGQDLRPARREAHGLEEQHMQVEVLPLAEAVGLIAAGGITDAKTVIGLSLAGQRLLPAPAT